MMRSKIAGGLAALAIGLVLSTSAYAVPYVLDDGVAETALGNAIGTDLLWLNAFNTQPGGEEITILSAQWGFSPFQTGANLPVSLLLYDDPNNDGDPSDAVLLTSVLTTASQYATGNFVDEAITPTIVSGGFFVAGLLQNAPDGGTFMAPIDTSTPQGRSWFAHGVGLDINDLSGASKLPIGVNPPTDGNFMLRAVGVAVPEPSTLALLAIALGGLGWMGRWRRKT